MIYTNNIEEVVKHIKTNKENKQEIIVRLGLRTNGDIHLGNILPITNAFIIGNKLTKLGYKFKLIVVLVDIEYNKNEQIPFIYQKDIYNCHKNLAEHSISIIKSFVNDLKLNRNIKVSFQRVSNLLKNNNFKKIIDHYLSQGKYEFKIHPLCKSCKSVNTEWSIFNQKIYFTCNYCKSKQFQNINSVEFAVDHNLLGAIENYFLPIDIHIIGRDHALINKKTKISSLQEREFYFNYLPKKDKEFITFLIPLIFGKNNKKMSKSLKNGLFLAQLKKKYNVLYYSKLYNLTKQIINDNIESIDFDFIKTNI